MRTVPRVIAVTLILLANAAAPLRLAYAANLDATADRVFGQADFTHDAPGLTASRLYNPNGVALDAQGHLYLADSGNNRVLEFDTPLSATAGANADRVFGQPTLITNTANYNGVSATGLNNPTGVALDGLGNMYVADSGNNRVLEYDAPLNTDRVADRVFGQPDFHSNAVNNGGLNADSLDQPYGLAFDAHDNLYVADAGNNRVLEYDTPLGTDTTADRVFGQPNLYQNIPNNGGLSASSLYFPTGVALDALGNLFVADHTNSRVLEYDTPLTLGTTADRVFGQPDFTHSDNNHGGLSASSLSGPIDAALDASGHLYVTDYGNNRVLEYDTPLSLTTAADRVLGQPTLITNTANILGVSANSLFAPQGVTLDAHGNLYVADSSNHRVLEYDVPAPYGVPALAALSPSTVAAGSPTFTLTVNGSGFVSDSRVRWNSSDRPTTFQSSTRLSASIAAADVAAGGPVSVTVFTPAPGGGTSSVITLPLYARAIRDATADVVQGQPSFVTNTLNIGGLSATGLDHPFSVVVDQHSGRLFVADTNNHRVLSWPNAPDLASGQPADLVLGQPDFTDRIPNYGGLGARSLFAPIGLAVDAQGNLYVADRVNHRVLEFDAPLSSGVAANRVFGQPDLNQNLPNNGGLSATSLLQPWGLALDALGNLYVADSGNNRVLEYDAPLSSGMAASRVFGQSDFTHNTPQSGGLGLSLPAGVALDAHGNLYVADWGRSRVLEYDTPLTNNRPADRVFGQPDFSHFAPNTNGISANSLYLPSSVALDTQGNLFVADDFNNRVLEYDKPLSVGTTSDHVFGQPDFTHNTPNNGGVSANSLSSPTSVALDAQGNLWVVDYLNNRVLEYDWALLKLYLPLMRR